MWRCLYVDSAGATVEAGHESVRLVWPSTREINCAELEALLSAITLAKAIAWPEKGEPDDD